YSVYTTAKGYPDVNTRMFAKRLSVELKFPAVALMDSNPSGFHIFHIYKCGSETMSYDAAHLTTSHMKWLGLRLWDVGTYKIPEECSINLTPFDIYTCNRMFEEKESLIAS
ncbi:DNA topoisomerase 6 subunit a-like protein, partial [Trifolium pratense]